MCDSIHTFRWINQIKDEDFQILLFPSIDNPVLTKYDSRIKIVGSSYEIYNSLLNYKFIKLVIKFYLILKIKLYPDYLSKRLASVLKKFTPDLVHTLETQNSGYLLLDSFNFQKKDFFWWHTNWGSDILIFSKLEIHLSKISSLLSNVDFYSCECERDSFLARKLGYTNEILPVYPNAGGFSINFLNELKVKTDIPSKRKSIMLKGYQGWAGRGLVGLRALERCADFLKNYKILVFSNTSAEDIIIATKLFSVNNGIEVVLIPENTSHEEILEFHGQSRIYIGLSIGDGISTSLLESMAMGSFPIQSCTACANEWIENGSSGFIVPPEDPDVIELAIRKALLDDNLVDSAAVTNFDTIKNRVNFSLLKETTINSYKNILNLRKNDIKF